MNVYSLGTQMSSPFPLPKNESGVCLSLQYAVHQHILIALSGGDEREKATWLLFKEDAEDVIWLLATPSPPIERVGASEHLLAA